MSILDIIIVCCFLPALYMGISKGFIKQIVAIAVIFFGITLSLRFTDYVSNLLAAKLGCEGIWIKVLSLIIIFSVVAFVLSMLGKIVTKIIKVTLLGWADKLLGVVLSLFFTAVIISTLIYIFNSINELTGIISEDKIAESVLYNPLLNFAKTVFPYLGKLF